MAATTLDTLRGLPARAIGKFRRDVLGHVPRERSNKILHLIDPALPGLEIGPSHRPTVPKSKGHNVKILDHASAADLRAKYATHGLDLAAIEEVDYVWSGQRYRDLIGPDTRFDWIIASHVIEHTPSLIDFLQQCSEVLSDTGVLSLVVPDKRYCFDRFRERTALSGVIDAHVERRTVPSPGTGADYMLNVVKKGGVTAWQPGHRGGYQFVHSLAEAKAVSRDIEETGTFHDLHCWCFTPNSFRLLIEDLYALGYSDLREAHFEPTAGHEFFVSLTKSGAGPGLPRMDLLAAMARDDLAMLRQR